MWTEIPIAFLMVFFFFFFLLDLDVLIKCYEMQKCYTNVNDCSFNNILNNIVK